MNDKTEQKFQVIIAQDRAGKLLFSIVEDTRALGQEGTRKGSETMLKYDIIYGFAV